MRICVVVPSEQYLQQAGARIRYLRMAEHLAALGHKLELSVVGTFFRPAEFVHDVYLVSKCYDVRAVLTARLAKQAGKLVGADFFDDYFSQVGDSRFVPQREWLRSLSGAMDFVLASTDRMRQVVSELYAPGLPCHVMNDPFERLDAGVLAASIEEKVETVRAGGELRVAWFGVGDNPHFPIGLSDLTDFGHVLRELGRRHRVRLDILTNKRALTAAGLEAIRRLPVAHCVGEWSEEGERELLERSLVAFLPVRAQGFSIAKSLNRAVTALSSGAQVLSVGYPLYEPFAELIYRDAETFSEDLRVARMRLRGKTMPRLEEIFAGWADPRREASKFADFLVDLQKRRKTGRTSIEASSIGVVHGRKSSTDFHKMAQRAKQLSIGTPFSTPKLNYDVHFVLSPPAGLEIWLRESVIAKVRPGLEASMEPFTTPNGMEARRLKVADFAPRHALRRRTFDPSASKAASLAFYDLAMSAILACLDDVLPGVAVVLSEADPPYYPSARPVVAAPVLAAEAAE